jgi:outer membrane protein OmpA-like peptidoglycan-associated protein
VALRKAELAEVQAALAQDELRAANAKSRLDMASKTNQIATERDLEQTRAQLQAEQQRRQEAERAASEALSKLSSIASVKQEPRGVVITLSGAVIFASNKSDLLPTAKAKLNQVAEALKKSDPSARFEVDGYTDSRGPLQLNQDLSQRRAEAVRTYLVSQGVPDERITAQGLGPSNPVADNNTAEGRANNRRVEIIVKSENAQTQGEHSVQQQQSQQQQTSNTHMQGDQSVGRNNGSVPQGQGAARPIQPTQPTPPSAAQRSQ